MWARVFMSDLALKEGLGGEIALYDIDVESAKRNQLIGGYINKNPKALSKFDYKVYENIENALIGSDFVIISILPGTFEEMRSDVHEPEKYGIYQSVGDTAGPGGILRAMRTVPIYIDFAKKIKEYASDAWVINLTNPMTILTKTLYEEFKEIKAFGCCHEVLHTLKLFSVILKKLKNIDAEKEDLSVDVAGLNHFTWIDKAYYKDIDILKLIPEFEEKYAKDGYYEEGNDPFAFKYDPFAYGNTVKFDLMHKYGILPAAGDRHLAEFCPNDWYLKDKETVKKYHFNLTTVDYRIEDQKKKIEDTILYSTGKKEFVLEKSAEELVDMILALLGMKKLITNVNYPNHGQIEALGYNDIVETNCVFSANMVNPLLTNKLPDGVNELLIKQSNSLNNCYKGIKEKDYKLIFKSFLNQQLCKNLKLDDAKELFINMCENTKKYLEPYYDLNKLKEEIRSYR